ncbi:hypothetical protein PMZ80_003419 [Knufia obscura]|uniref:Small ribosomal subunit protein uS7 domain-containing protein n=2 Tax=Knufia TaxID=430999 RepID=A0AAN8ETT4_9EURO|nr:hypothetical protein PMZ80_003419 [Knufia obscura]KAK5958662.1 hypothetical protein OHC33_000505 [Knufia fluminis]
MASPRFLFRPVREVAFRPRPQVSKRKITPIVQTRFASNVSGNDQKVTPIPEGEKPQGPNEGVSHSMHVSEEQKAYDKIQGNETSPDVNQGTPVQEILQRDNVSPDKVPQVMKDEMQSPGSGQKRSYSTSARRLATAEMVQSQSQISENGLIQGMEYPDAGPGHKFPLPDVSDVSRLDHLKRRYDPVVEQVTKSIMRDGKLSIAQKNMSTILSILRTAPPPQINPAFPGRTLLISDSGTPTPPPNANPFAPVPAPNETQITSLPRSTLPLHPIEYLTTIIDSIAPLVKIRQQKGLAGGGASLPIPVPLGVRQRRRQAIQWILAAADGRKEVNLAERVAKTLVDIAEGKSSIWERRSMVHRLGVSARSNVRSGNKGRRR